MRFEEIEKRIGELEREYKGVREAIVQSERGLDGLYSRKASVESELKRLYDLLDRCKGGDNV